MKKSRLNIWVVIGLSGSIIGCQFFQKPAAQKSAPQQTSPVVVESLEQINSLEEYNSLIATDPGNGLSYVKYVHELAKSERKTYFQNTAKYPFHLNFLNAKVPGFSIVTLSQWSVLIGAESTANVAAREYLAGTLYYIPRITLPGATEPGAIVFELITAFPFQAADVQIMVNELKKKIPFIKGKFGMLMARPAAVTPQFRTEMKAAGIPLVPFQAIIANSDKAITYVDSTGYGYLKRFTPIEVKEGDYSSKNILLLDEIPRDIGPVAGVVTSGPQVPHSHVVLRTANLKIPNI